MSSMYPPQHPSIELFLRRTARGLGRSRARTSSIASYLQPFAGRAAATYGQAQAAEQGVGQAVSSGLTQLGRELGGDISSALQGIQAPGQAVSTYGGGTAATGAAAGQAAGALSSAELGRLRGHSTAEQVYASALPRLAQLAGDQERRMLFAQAQEDLADLALRVQGEQAENAWRERQFAYEMQRDRVDDRRRLQEARERRQDRRWDRRMDKRELQRQAKLDRMAAEVARQEYGLDVADYQLDVQKHRLDEQELAERRRAAKAREAQAAAREKRMAAGKGTAKDRRDYFYEVREDAFARARKLAEPTENEYGRLVKLPKAQARQRLWQEFGTVLVGRGYPRKAVEQMIARALKAAGY